MGRKFIASVKSITALVKKDLIDEFRSRYAITAIALFSLTTLVMVSFSTGVFSLDPGLHAAFLWIIIFFSAMTALARSFIKEEENCTSWALRLSTSAEIIFIGKLVFNLIIILALIFVLYPMYMILMSPPKGGNVLLTINFLILGSLCLAGTTTILSAITAKAGAKNSLLPVIAFPVLLPVLLMSIQGTTAALAGMRAVDAYSEIVFLFSFLVIIVTASLLLFTYVWEA
ncbi:MAG: heme exporter protein CcmB [Bacillota bacterium]